MKHTSRARNVLTNLALAAFSLYAFRSADGSMRAVGGVVTALWLLAGAMWLLAGLLHGARLLLDKFYPLPR